LRIAKAFALSFYQLSEILVLVHFKTQQFSLLTNGRSNVT
jgi:hypothetical protein